jgi:hypothetical protein
MFSVQRKTIQRTKSTIFWDSSTLKMEVTCSFETSVDFQRTTRRYIPEDSTLHNHLCENLKSHILKVWVWSRNRFEPNPEGRRISQRNSRCFDQNVCEPEGGGYPPPPHVVSRYEVSEMWGSTCETLTAHFSGSVKRLTKSFVKQISITLHGSLGVLCFQARMLKTWLCLSFVKHNIAYSTTRETQLCILICAEDL